MTSKKSIETKARIEQAALNLFAEKGVQYTSIKDISKASGLSDGAMYRHFKSKEELITHLFVNNYIPFTETIEKMCENEVDFNGKLKSIISGFCELFDNNPSLFAFLMFSQYDTVKFLPKGSRTPVCVIDEVVSQGMKESCIQENDISEISAVLMGIVLQSATFCLYGRIKSSMKELSDKLYDRCIKAVS